MISSWLANPIAVGLSVCLGFSGSPLLYVQYILIGVAAPFQLFLNESAASSLYHHRIYGLMKLISVVMLCLVPTLIFSEMNYKYLDLTKHIFLIISTSSAILVSFLCAKESVRQVRNNFMTKYRIIIIGACPGITLSMLYLLLSGLIIKEKYDWLLILIQPIPSLVQLSILKFYSTTFHVSDVQEKSAQYTQSFITLRKVLFSLLGLVVVGSTIGVLRDKISGGPGKYSILIVIMLNMITSISMLMSRGIRVKEKVRNDFFTYFLIGIVFIIISMTTNNKINIYMQLISAQSLLVAMICSGRYFLIINDSQSTKQLVV